VGEAAGEVGIVGRRGVSGGVGGGEVADAAGGAAADAGGADQPGGLVATVGGRGAGDGAGFARCRGVGSGAGEDSWGGAFSDGGVGAAAADAAARRGDCLVLFVSGGAHECGGGAGVRAARGAANSVAGGWVWRVAGAGFARGGVVRFCGGSGSRFRRSSVGAGSAVGCIISN